MDDEDKTRPYQYRFHTLDKEPQFYNSIQEFVKKVQHMILLFDQSLVHLMEQESIHSSLAVSLSRSSG
eukprot:Pgem_evm1s400